MLLRGPSGDTSQGNRRFPVGAKLLLRAWLLLNNNRPHAHNQDADDDAQKNKTDGVCVFQKIERVRFLLDGFVEKWPPGRLLNRPITFGRRAVS